MQKYQRFLKRKYTVGCAILCKNGRIYKGVDCDGIHGSCAEYVTMGIAISNGEREFSCRRLIRRSFCRWTRSCSRYLGCMREKSMTNTQPVCAVICMILPRKTLKKCTKQDIPLSKDMKRFRLSSAVGQRKTSKSDIFFPKTTYPNRFHRTIRA